MTVSNRQLSLLAGIAAALLVLTIALYGVQCKPAADFQKGALLIQGLELDKIQSVKLTKADKTVTLERKGTGFVVPERNGYPASVKKVNELFIDCLGIRIADKITSSADNHKDLGVVEDADDAVVVRFYGAAPKAGDDGKKQDAEASDKPLVGVVVGKSVSKGSGSYIRLLDSDTVYASEKSVYLATEVTSYIETEILDVKKDDVLEAKVTLPDEAYTVTRDKDNKVVLAKVPEGKKQKDYDVEAVLDALSYLTFSDILTEAPDGLKFDATYVASTKDHMTYTVRLAKNDDKHFARLAARGASRDQVEKASTIKKDDPKEKLEEKDRVFTSLDKAKEFNATHGPWVYELSSWKAEKMRKPSKDLLEDIEKEPEEIAASHILVAYKGAEKAGDDVTRTKDEAKTRAEELLEKVKDDGADFAEIAEKESDGPSKDKGGDLGTFKKGTMHENFEKAAWKLEVDAISDVVESPFGFHIIKRTK